MLPLQSVTQQQDTLNRIWQALLVLPNKTINLAQTDNHELAGWINLAKQSRTAVNATDLQKKTTNLAASLSATPC